jgi:hypothetical protein
MSLLKQLYGVNHSDIYPDERKEIDRVYRRILDIRSTGSGSASGEHYILALVLKRCGVKNLEDSASVMYAAELILLGER